MISTKQMEVNIFTEFISEWQEAIGHEPEDDEEKFLTVLKIRRWQLRRVCRNDVLKLEHLPTLKHGIRQAELVLHGLDDQPPSKEVTELRSLIWKVVMQLAMEITHTEEQYPEMKVAFDQERADYREVLAWAAEAETE